jgi:MFS family permease
VGRGLTGARPGPLTSAALLLYPPSWRERYADEVLAMLEEAGASPAAAASLALRAMPAWVNPPRHLHDRQARMRTSVGTVLLAWSALTGIGIVFAMLTQLQGFRAPGHPLVQWCYLVFDGALVASVLTAAIGGLPLWLQMIRLARRQRRGRDLACLLLAVIVPAGYVVAAVIALIVVHHPEASGPWWFVGFAILGFGAAGLASAGPVVALNRLAPDGPAVLLAATAAGVAAATIALAGVASSIAAAGLCLWSTSFAGYHDGALAGAYVVLVVAVGATATISATRGVRAALTVPAP